MKYGNRKVVVNNIRFDSKAEAERYLQLLALQNAGTISELVLQPEFVLVPAFTKNGKHYRKITYLADFKYKLGDDTYVEDVKGFKTEVYRIKKKLFEYKYPELELLEVKA